MSNDTFKAQNRGGKGIKGMQTLDEDYVEEFFMTNTHHYHYVLYEHRTCIPPESIRDPGGKQNIQRNSDHQSATADAGREDQCGHSD